MLELSRVFLGNSQRISYNFTALQHLSVRAFQILNLLAWISVMSKLVKVKVGMHEVGPIRKALIALLTNSSARMARWAPPCRRMYQANKSNGRTEPCFLRVLQSCVGRGRRSIVKLLTFNQEIWVLKLSVLLNLVKWIFLKIDVDPAAEALVDELNG